MRLLPISLLCTLFASAAIASPPEVPGEISEEEPTQPTVFNGVEVPALPEIEGEKFNATIKEGYWFMKHHS
jgi:protein disulfide-isomerase